ncbi:sugar-binding transcriptional regulator [Pseudogracilibacillus auburnensis]|uniref:sugar-binding transcriptional regulator n=1 Tax=Pseudogracilibacillus auburnensis TaxID=1494959 RepID=UPI001A97B81A|nr:sugar-binding transcriptional regulator [Pseudogracilibacillus auburnensis]MBO1001991.1 sugar-binding transcriptional regulator [Pseudogracilibacillus auburnensis]
MTNWEERRHLVKIANMYYNDNWTQEQIAKKFSVSRPVISKALQKAKQIGIIKVFINDKTFHTVKLEEKLEEKYNLNDVLIVPSSDQSVEMTTHAVAKAGANYLSKNMKEIKSLGISWGETLTALVKEYPFEMRENVKIVPLEGGMGTKKVDIHANQLAYELSNRMGGTCTYLYAPAIVESKELYERLIGMEDIELVLNEGKNVDMALIGIGNPYHNSTLETLGYIQNEEKDLMREKGVVGDLGFRFFDESGSPLTDILDKQVIGISLNSLKQINKVVAVVSGVNKVDSLRAALKGKFIDVLITDQKTASMLDKFE